MYVATSAVVCGTSRSKDPPPYTNFGTIGQILALGYNQTWTSILHVGHERERAMTCHRECVFDILHLLPVPIGMESTRGRPRDVQKGHGFFRD